MARSRATLVVRRLLAKHVVACPVLHGQVVFAGHVHYSQHGRSRSNASLAHLADNVKEAVQPTEASALRKEALDMRREAREAAAADNMTKASLLFEQASKLEDKALEWAKVSASRSSAEVVMPPFASTNFDLESFVNGRINNRQNRPFVERQVIVERVLASIELTETVDVTKPRATVLWSPRGTGKSSLLRHLVLQELSVQERAVKGRVLIADMQHFPENMDPQSTQLLSALVLEHLCAIFVGSRLEVAGKVVNFPQNTVTLSDILDVLIGRTKPLIPPEFQRWILEAGATPERSFSEWQGMTKEAFEAPDDCKCLVLMDQVEVLALRINTERASRYNGVVSLFTRMCSKMPQLTAFVAVGTINEFTKVPHEEYTLLIVDRLPALRPLSLEGTREMMTNWGGQQYDTKTLEAIQLFSRGVPRLLERVFSKRGNLATLDAAVDAMSSCYLDSYASAALFLEQRETAVPLLLSAAVNWRRGADTDQVPGTTFEWEEIFTAGAAFPDGDDVMIPMVWWSQDQGVVQSLTADLSNMGIRLNDLYPEPLVLLSGPRGALQRGIPFERLFASSLVARFFLLCRAEGADPATTWLPFLAIYPTDSEHIREMFGGFSVCWPQGILDFQEQKRKVTVEHQIGQAIIINGQGGHHDVLVPVRNDASGAQEYVALCLRYGQPKTAAELHNTQQHQVDKGRGGIMPNKLLQVASGSQVEGRQTFTAKKQDVLDVWNGLQNNYQYGIITGRRIVSSIEVLEII